MRHTQTNYRLGVSVCDRGCDRILQSVLTKYFTQNFWQSISVVGGQNGKRFDRFKMAAHLNT